jgi:glycosyltransferase involved in cell wall biosynthesis
MSQSATQDQTAPDATPALELTILMPCLNEAETLAVCIKKAKDYLAREGIAGEVLISDNGSTDGSQKIATDLGARVVHAPERGYGAALINGIAHARGRFIIMGDSDDSYDFSSLGPYVEKLREGYDLVMGNRFRGGIDPGAMPFLHRYLGTPVLTFLGRLFFNVPAGDYNCGLRGFSRDAIRALGLRSTGMEFASEMIVKAGLNRLKIAEVPTRLAKDGRSRPPHLKTWRDGWRHLRFLLMHTPRFLFVYPGLILILLGALAAGLVLPGPLLIAPGVTLDVHTLVVAAFMIVCGVQLVMTGAIARRYATKAGFVPQGRGPWSNWIDKLTLEPLLIAGGFFALAGLIGMVWAFSAWGATDFGALDYTVAMRLLVPSAAAAAVGLQLFFSAFLMSILDIPVVQTGRVEPSSVSKGA